MKTIETSLAVKDGATEIDMVLSVGAFLEGDYETVCDEIQQMKEACGDKKMKVILETGCLQTAANIKAAQALGIHTYHIRRDELVRNLFEGGVLKEGIV